MDATSILLVEEINIHIFVSNYRSAETVIPQGYITALLVCQRDCYQF
jgi:hypothetical protein